MSVPVTLAPGTAYPASEHFVCVMLADEATGTPVIVDYHGLTKRPPTRTATSPQRR